MNTLLLNAFFPSATFLLRLVLPVDLTLHELLLLFELFFLVDYKWRDVVNGQKYIGSKVLTESELLECLMGSLWEQEINEDDFKCQPDAVATRVQSALFVVSGGSRKNGSPDVVFPTGVLDTDGVDKLIEEARATAEELENCNTLGANVVREELDKECYSMKRVSDTLFYEHRGSCLL